MTKPSKSSIDPRSARLERMDAIECLSKRLGHDFNNLFGIIIGAMGVLKDEASLRSELHDLKAIIDDVESAGREGAEFVSLLLACVGLQNVSAEFVQPNRLIENVVDRTKNSIDTNISLDLGLYPNLPTIYVDTNRFTESMEGLIANALEAMPAGGTLGIVTDVRHRDDVGTAAPTADAERFLGITVMDSGEGIDPELMKRVTEPFFTTRNPSKNRGLGLSLAYGFALQSGGALCIDNNSSGGITVTVWLPEAAEDKLSKDS